MRKLGAVAILLVVSGCGGATSQSGPQTAPSVKPVPEWRRIAKSSNSRCPPD